MVYKIWTGICSLFTAIAFCVNLAQPEAEMTGEGALFEVIWNIGYSLNKDAMISVILFAGAMFLAWKVNVKSKDKQRLVQLASAGISVIWLLAKCFQEDVPLHQLTASAGQVVKACIYVAGMMHFLVLLFYGFDGFLYAEKDIIISLKSRTMERMKGHVFRNSMILLLICWAPHVLISFPGYMCPDAWVQLSQVLGTQFELTTHNPPVPTLLMGYCVEIGKSLFMNENIGLFLIIIVQYISFSAVLAYGFLIMERLDAPKWLKLSSFLICVVCPYYTQYVATVIKDMMYSYAVLLFVLESICMLVEGRSYFDNKRHIVLYSIATVGTYVFRNNGRYVLFPAVLAFAAYISCHYRRERGGRRKLLKPVLILILPVFLGALLTEGVINIYHIQKGSIAEALSFPFQKTARYVSEHGEEVTEEEAKVISKILDYGNLADLYDPRISDPVKATYNKQATAADLVDYLEVWVMQGMKHPGTYIAATINQSYPLIYPFEKNMIMYDSTVIEGIGSDVRDYYNIHEVKRLRGSKKIITEINRGLVNLPIVGIVSHIAFYNGILIALLCFSLYRKKKIFWLASIPILFSDIVVVLAPAIQMHPRYAFPVVYSVPFLLAYYCYLIKNRV